MTSGEIALTFPPLMWGEAAQRNAFDHACMRATLGCEAGLVTYVLGPTQVEGALVFAPEVPLGKAMAMLPLCGVSLQNALGALAPPEVAVHLGWEGGIHVNGASCGQFRVMASDIDPGAVPDWLDVGFSVPLLPDENPGANPGRTALYAEGCAEIDPPALVESWSRHTLNWINRWETDGPRALHAEWRGLAYGLGEPAAPEGQNGTFLGIDEDFGMLLRVGSDTHLIPLTTLLESPP